MVLNDRILGVAALLLAVFLIIFGYDLEAPFAYEPVGPKAFPLLLALVIGLCGLRLFIKGGGEVEANSLKANGRIALLVVILVGYALLFRWLGFIIATTIVTTLMGRLFNGSWRNCILGGAVMSVLFYLLFDRVLDVVLPMGLLEGLL